MPSASFSGRTSLRGGVTILRRALIAAAIAACLVTSACEHVSTEPKSNMSPEADYAEQTLMAAGASEEDAEAFLNGFCSTMSQPASDRALTGFAGQLVELLTGGKVDSKVAATALSLFANATCNYRASQNAQAVLNEFRCQKGLDPCFDPVG